jgi:hypothetical protein
MDLPTPHARLKKMAAYMIGALAQIKQLPDDEGTMTCPACGGTLVWNKRGPKKHVYGACTTSPDCLSFLE